MRWGEGEKRRRGIEVDISQGTGVRAEGFGLVQPSQLSQTDAMRTVSVGELKNQLSAYLQYVRKGEEVIVKDRNKPVARILPIEDESLSDVEARLVAEGKLKLPEREMDWDAFFALPKAGNVSRKKVLEAVRWAKGNR